MSSREPSPGSSATRDAGLSDAHRLVSAMCHEISNLVAAVRLQAHLLDDELSPRALALASLEIDDLSARASALLALIKPILAGSVLAGETRQGSAGVGVDAIVYALESAVEDYGVGGVKVTIEPSPERLDVALDPDVIHHLLLAQIFGAMEDADPGSHVRVRIEARDHEVIFAIEGSAAIEEEHLEWQRASLRGRALDCAIAQSILATCGGRVEVSREGSGSRTALHAPRAGG